jgi:SAM-dependent methyltransferase
MGHHGMTDELRLDFPAFLAADFPVETPVAIRVVNEVLTAIQGSTFAPLEDRSPGLRGSDFVDYLRCSQIRMAHAANALARHGVSRGRVLDYGAYFGNFSLMFRELGFSVEAVDAYGEYSTSLAPNVELMRSRGIGVHDFAAVGRDVAGLEAEHYDVVLCMGVIEHVPHTPRVLLEPINRVLKTGGVLVMDTPNLAQLANRQKLARGEAIMTPIAVQYHAAVPFEGHHREYTADELVWMVQALGHCPLVCEMFNYSQYAHQTLSGRDVSNHWRQVATPDLRELVLVLSQKVQSAGREVKWTAVFEDVERYWRERLPATIREEGGDAIAAAEPLVVQLQQEVRTRDEMLAALDADRTAAIQLRDGQLTELRTQVDALRQRLAATESERLKRFVRRWLGGKAPGDEY